MTPSATAHGAWLRPEGQRPYVLGHRGARHAAPENTLAAFELALREGADGVELDVRLDGSGRVIVLHDVRLERVSSGSERRAAETLSESELSRVDVGQGERVPLLADVLAWARERTTRVNVEVKSDVRRPHVLIQNVARLLRASGASPEQIVLSSFHPLFVIGLSLLAGSYPVGFLVDADRRLLRRAPLFRELGASGVHPHRALVTPASVARWKRRGAFVNTWTVNAEDEAQKLAAFGVDAIISDRPGAILAALTNG
jgi:glycerophosphoryl diester phosphodiesterase